jgi:hypothetical protein
MGLRVVGAAGIVVAALAGCGGDDAPFWPGPPRPLPRDGALPVEGFADYLDAVDAPWERSLAAVATMYALPASSDSPDVHAAFVTSDPDGNAIVNVTVALQDDSVREVRYILWFDPRDDGAFAIVGGEWTQRCHAGRGHQDWSRELCT